MHLREKFSAKSTERCWLKDSGENTYNHDFCNLYKELEPTRNMRLRGLCGGGDVMRMKDETVLMKAVKEDTEGRRTIGRPRGRWLDTVDRKLRTRRNAELETVGGRR
jgi:hypothetical protein